MAYLLASLTVMGVLLSVALPVWSHQAKREREAELIFRGEQYARAVVLYQRQIAGGFPGSIEELVEGRFLRRRYRDPMTKDGVFELVFQDELTGLSEPIESSGQPEAMSEQSNNARTREGRIGAINDRGRDQRSLDLRGGIVGVVSKSKDLSIGRYRGADRYSEWKFTALENSDFQSERAGR